MRKFQFIFCLLLLAGLIFVLPAYTPHSSVDAGSRKGRVVSVKGGRFARHENGKWVDIKSGSKISFGDKVRTGKRAIAVLEIPGKGRFVIGPNSKLKIGKDSNDFSATLDQGAVWVDARLTKGSIMNIRSPMATAGVRGTRFSVMADHEGGAVCTCTGEVDVTLNDGRTLQSTKGTFVPIEYDGTGPESASPDFLLLRRKKDDRYQWCFTCHEVGGRGELKRNWR